MKNKTCFLLAFCALFFLQASAQESAVNATSDIVENQPPRPAENVKAVALGAVDMLDTYLSQEKYKGSELRFLTQSYVPSRRLPGWGWQTTSMVSMLYASPRADNSDYLGGMFTYAKALRRTFSAPCGWLLEVGPQIEGGVGFTYTTLGGNNPAQAKIYLNAGADLAAGRDFNIFRRTVTLRGEVSVPLAGVLFSPNYGQSYYEIFSRGNYDHNIVPVTLLAAPSLRGQLSADIHLKKFALRLAYLGDIEQAKVNNLKYHTYSHLLTIGIVKKIF